MKTIYSIFTNSRFVISSMLVSAMLVSSVLESSVVANELQSSRKDFPEKLSFQTKDLQTIRYVDVGPKAAEPVILIHGYYAHVKSNWWDNGLIPALVSNGFRVIAPDLRGHGHSSKPLSHKMYGQKMVTDVIDLLNHLKVQRAHFHGYSMGGSVLTEILFRRPELFLSAVYGGSGIPESDPNRRPEDDVTGRDPDEDAAYEAVVKDPLQNHLALNAVRQNPPLKISTLSRLDLSAVKTPVLSIHGEFDFPNLRSSRMRRELINYRMIILKGKSHLTAVMAPFMPVMYLTETLKFLRQNTNM